MQSILTDLSAPALSTAIEENEIGFWLYRAPVAGWEVRQDAELTVYVSGHQGPMDNGVLRTNLPHERADARIAALQADFARRRLPLVWWGGPSRRPMDLGERLVAHGFQFLGDDPGMAADLHHLNEDQPRPEGLAISRVTDDAGTFDWVRTLRSAEGQLPEAPIHRELNVPATYAPDDPYRLYVARLEGEPVATAAMLLHAGVAGLYCVSTVPRARRQGIGAAIVLAALREARAEGYRAGVLGATEMGYGVYRRLGFQQHCLLQSYTWRPPISLDDLEGQAP
jgi:GNAT superfamily N-acetyltransferase